MFSCAPHAPESHPPRTRRAPELFNSCAEGSRNVAPRANMWPNFGEIWLTSTKHWPTFGRSCSKLGQLRPTLTRIDQSSAKVGGVFTNSAQFWPLFADVRRTRRNMGQIWASACRCSPTPAKLGPNPGPRGSCSATFAQLLGDSGTCRVRRGYLSGACAARNFSASFA